MFALWLNLMPSLTYISRRKKNYNKKKENKHLENKVLRLIVVHSKKKEKISWIMEKREILKVSNKGAFTPENYEIHQIYL